MLALELAVSHCTVFPSAQKIENKSFKGFLDHVLYSFYFERAMVTFQKTRERKASNYKSCLSQADRGCERK